MCRCFVSTAASAALLLASVPAAAGLAVSPVLIEKSVSPDDDVLEFVVSNSGARPLRISLSAGPLVHDRSGAPIAPGEPYPFDASRLLRFEQESFELGARRWKRIRARVQPPARDGGGYAFLYVRGHDPAEAAGNGVLNVVQIAIVVELTFGSAPPASVVAQEPRLQDRELRVAVRNTGRTHARPTGAVSIAGGDGVVRWRAPLVPANVFPGLVRELKVAGTPPSLPDGAYVLSVRLDADARPALQRHVEVAGGELSLPTAGSRAAGE